MAFAREKTGVFGLAFRCVSRKKQLRTKELIGRCRFDGFDPDFDTDTDLDFDFDLDFDLNLGLDGNHGGC